MSEASDGLTMSERINNHTPAERAAVSAIGYVLGRIRDDRDIRNRMGVATESFDRLTKAYAELTGQAKADVCERFIKGSSEMHPDGEDA